MNLFYSQVLQTLFVSLVWVWERRWYVSPFSHLLILLLSLCWKVGLRGGSAVKNLPTGAGYAGSIPGFGRSPGEGNGYPLQYSCLESSMDTGAWRAYSPWCHKELTQLSNLERGWKARWWKWFGNFIIGSEGTSPADSASCLSSFPASSSLSQTACWARSYCEKNFCKESIQVTLPKPWEKHCRLLELRNLGLSWEHRVPVGRGMQVCVYTLSGCGSLPVGVGTPCLG